MRYPTIVLVLTALGCPASGADPVDADEDGFLDDVDCDDTDPAIHPGAVEVCGPIDHDCDGIAGDEDDSADRPTFYADEDGDGYGDPAVSMESCDPPAGYVGNGDDCDDTSAAIHPGAVDTVNGVDDDCDGDIDDGNLLERFTPGTLTELGASLVSGDLEFGGFGPLVEVLVEVVNAGSQVDVRVLASFEETAYNWTTAEVDATFGGAYFAPKGCSIVAVQDAEGGQDPTVLETSRSYVDDDTDPDTLPGDHIIDEITIVGDLVGPDVGFGTGVASLSFRELGAVLYCPE